MTTDEFIASQKLSMSCAAAYDNPNMTDASPGMQHYSCVIRRGKRRLTVPFSVGSGWTREPSAADVLDCLASDAAGVENARGFLDWCGEYGYDTDSRKAERTFKVCERQAAKLKRFLGADLYQVLLFDVERQ